MLVLLGTLWVIGIPALVIGISLVLVRDDARRRPRARGTFACGSRGRDMRKWTRANAGCELSRVRIRRFGWLARAARVLGPRDRTPVPPRR